jgi:hypothetical protein
MVGWGILLIIMGAGSLLLPSLGFQFRLMELVDAYQPYVGIVVAIIGAVLVVLGMTRGSRKTAKVGQEPAAAAGPGDTPPSDDAYRP